MNMLKGKLCGLKEQQGTESGPAQGVEVEDYMVIRQVNSSFFLIYAVGNKLLLITDMKLESNPHNHCVWLLNRFKIYLLETSGIFSKDHAIA